MADEKWFREHDMANKLKAALESVVVGQGLGIVFDGLEKGDCVVNVVYNGETVTFLNIPPLDKKPVVESLIIPKNDACEPDLEGESELKDEREEKPKRKRTRKKKIVEPESITP